MAVACQKDKTVDFDTDRTTIEIGENGGVEKVRISSSGEWVASMEMDKPWVTISPANGRGTETCDFIIDSALTTKPRTGVVTVKNIETNEVQRITINQKGYDYSVEIVDSANREIDRYAAFGERYFDVKVRSNFEFNVVIPDEAKSWLSAERYTLTLDRGIRPRETTVRFNWKINNSSFERLADVRFEPKASIEVVKSEVLKVKQEAAEPIKPNTREGDSLSLLNIASTLQTWSQWDTSTSMAEWNGIELWQEHMEGCTKENIGRVRKAEFFLFNSFEGIPFEVQYLTAAEELYFFSNTNSMLKSLDMGEHITKLTNLKRLTVGAYGLTSLPDSFKEMKALEYLNLGSNNFTQIPSVLTKENFPNLHALVMNANQRRVVTDLYNSVYKEPNELGGLIEEQRLPELLKWGLDTLVLSVNFLHGALPSFEDDPTVERYTEEEIIAADTLPMILKGTPKIMPKTKTFRINLNRFSGEAPFWLLYHPALDWWIPYSLIFSQEGYDGEGNRAGFTNTPDNFKYYYEAYTKKTPQDLKVTE